MKNLSEKVILYHLKISMWTATKMDKNVTKEVEDNHSATDAGRFNKILIAKKDLSKLKSIVQEARAFHNKQTLPWTDDGGRLLPAANFFEYTNTLREFKQQFEQAVEDFFSVYPDLKKEAKLRLNTMFNEIDYPSLAKLKNKFGFETEPMAIAEDVRISINQQEVARLKQEIEDNIYKKIGETTKDMWLRMKEVVHHMHARLSEKDAKFKNSLVMNIRDLVDLLPRLNFTNDPDINDAIDDMKMLLVNPEDLRRNDIVRRETAQNAKELLSKINDFVSDDLLSFKAA